MLKVLTKMTRKEEDPLPWARHVHEVGENTTAPPPRSCDEESNTTHHVLIHQVPIPIIPFDLGLSITSIIQGRVEGSVGGVVSHAIACPIPSAVFQPTFLLGFLARTFAIIAARISRAC